jgi:hypothetical protein
MSGAPAPIAVDIVRSVGGGGRMGDSAMNQGPTPGSVMAQGPSQNIINFYEAIGIKSFPPKCQDIIIRLGATLDSMGVIFTKDTQPRNGYYTFGQPSNGYILSAPVKVTQEQIIEIITDAMTKIQQCMSAGSVGVSNFTSNRPSAFAPEPYDRWD